MQRIAMLGSGFIGRFYADSLQGYRSKDKIVSVYSRREESAKKFAGDYSVSYLNGVEYLFLFVGQIFFSKKICLRLFLNPMAVI